jgi:hypothetical protein
MKRLNFKLVKKVKQIAAVSILAASLIGSNLVFAHQPNAAAAAPSFGGPFNCDSNAVLHCGAPKVAVIQKDYKSGDLVNSAASIQHIYNYFNISTADVSSLNTKAVAGTVTKSGDVLVGGKVVATGARTAGRTNQAGSVKRVVNGTTFYGRPTSISFAQSSLTAYVVMQNGQFKFAILSSCGNPVNAVAKPAPKPVAGALACVNLLGTPATTPESDGSVAYTFTAKATATNATITSYTFDFGPNNGGLQPPIKSSALTLTSKSVTFAPGTHAVSVVVAGSVKNGNTTVAKAITCKTTFTVNQKGALACVSLTKDAGSTDASGNMSHMLTVTAAPPTNGATITGYHFDVQPVNSVTIADITSSDQTAKTDTIVFAPGQTYKVTATVNGTDANGKSITATSPNCQVTISPEQIVTTAVVTPTQPTQLANTGAGSVIGLFAGASIAGFLGYRYFLSRKLSNK